MWRSLSASFLVIDALILFARSERLVPTPCTVTAACAGYLTG